jgi:hypothetical protein
VEAQTASLAVFIVIFFVMGYKLCVAAATASSSRKFFFRSKVKARQADTIFDPLYSGVFFP